jgi:hypothetical protein
MSNIGLQIQGDEFLPKLLERIREPVDSAMPVLKCIIGAMSSIVLFLCVGLPLLAGVTSYDIDAWGDVFNKIDPYLWAAFGIFLVVGFSVVGAAW